MISVVNKFGNEKLKELTDLVKESAEESYYFDDFLINVFSQISTTPANIGQAAIFVDKKVVDLKYNEVPLMTIEDVINTATQQTQANFPPLAQVQQDPFLNTLLRLFPAIIFTADARAKKKIKNPDQYYNTIYSLGENIFDLNWYERFCQRFDISPKILQVPLLNLFLIANVPNFDYYLTRNHSIKKGITTFLLYHEIGHKRISPITEEMGQKLSAAAAEVATPLDPLKQDYVNMFTDTILNIASMLNGPQREEFKIGFNANYQFDISAPSINYNLPSLTTLVFLDVTARLGQQKEGDSPDWVEQMFPKEYEIIKPVSIKIARSLAEDVELADKMYNQKAAQQEIGIFYKRLRDQSKWERKIKFYAKLMNSFKEPSQIERKKMSPMPNPRIPLIWGMPNLDEAKEQTNSNQYDKFADMDTYE